MMRYLAELPARWFRAGAVTFNTSFLGENAFRDQLTAYLFLRWYLQGQSVTAQD